MVQYFRKTIGGIKRTSYAGEQRISIMIMRDEYRSYTNTKMKQIVVIPHFTHGAYLDKLRGIAQNNSTKWADLVNHIPNTMRVSWVRSNCTRKQQEVPWSSTPTIRVRPADASRESPDKQCYRNCWPSTRHRQRIYIFI